MELLENLKVVELVKKGKGFKHWLSKWETDYKTHNRKERCKTFHELDYWKRPLKKLKVNRTKAKSRLKVIARTIKGFENE